VEQLWRLWGPTVGGELSFLAKNVFQYIQFFIIVTCWYIGGIDELKV
jgi:hypothetical protein